MGKSWTLKSRSRRKVSPKKTQKNCIVSLKLSPPSSHFQHTENFIQSQEKLHPFIETLIPAIIQPSSSHHPAIPSCAGDKLPLLRPIFPAVRSMTSPKPRPMVSLSQLPKPPTPRADRHAEAGLLAT
jgi:hypothetical protein